MGIGRPGFFRSALVELDDAALRSVTMVEVFDQMRRLRGYVDGFPGRDWNLATARTYDGVWQAVGYVCDLFSEDECYNFYKAAGYETN